jgi:dolichyl-diphosphooligosaccharide---protein glycosyltransferase
MAEANSLQPFLKGETSKSTRGLLRIIILCTIAAAAVSARLFSVIRMSPFQELQTLE